METSKFCFLVISILVAAGHSTFSLTEAQLRAIIQSELAVAAHNSASSPGFDELTAKVEELQRSLGEFEAEARVNMRQYFLQLQERNKACGGVSSNSIGNWPSTPRNLSWAEFDRVVGSKSAAQTGSSFNGSSLNVIMSTVSRAGDGERATTVVFINHLDRTINNFQMYDRNNATFNPAPPSIAPHTKEVFTFAEPSCCFVRTAFSYNIAGTNVSTGSVVDTRLNDSFALGFLSSSTNMEDYFETRTGIPGSSKNLKQDAEHYSPKILVGYQNFHARMTATATGSNKISVVIELIESSNPNISRGGIGNRPSRGGLWKELLGADIVPAGQSTIASADVLAEFKALLADPVFLHTVYSNYVEAYKKESIRFKDLAHEVVFQQHLFEIVEHNLEFKAGRSSWQRGVNQFTDMTEAEVVAKYTGYTDSFADYLANSTIPMIKPRQVNAKVVTAIDWRTRGAVTSIKHQGRCGSCYAFAAAATLESSHIITHGQAFNLSTQEVIDCSKANGNNGCAGGSFIKSFNYMGSNGLTDWESYEYEARDDQPCRRAGKDQAARVTGWWRVQPSESEDALMNAVSSHGPIAVGIHVNQAFIDYRNAIFESPCVGKINHAVVVIGYGTENGVDFWIVKNQWGVGWGDGGFIRMRRNYGNLCSIASRAVYISA